VRSTLFYIPAEFAGLPVVGFGWMLIAWIALSLVILGGSWVRNRSARELTALVPMLLIVAGIIAFGLPLLVEQTDAGDALGIPVRGFGVMMMLAIGAALTMACVRAQQMGVHPEFITGLATVMILAGLIGARLFYVLQYWREFVRPDIWQTMRGLFNITSGGLVVYGSVIAGLPAGIWYLRRHKLPVLAIGDIIAPSMVVGLALGRVGCFLNGCCFGGACLPGDFGSGWALRFPAASPPYIHQTGGFGWKSGVWLERDGSRIVAAYVAPDGSAHQSGLRRGDEVLRINGADVTSLEQARQRLADSRGAYEIQTAGGDVFRWSDVRGPAASVPVHPTQLYSALDAALLAALLWFYYPFRRRDGEVFALLITLHPVSRFLLERIRDDEAGQFETELTISQWLSLAILAAAAALWWYILRQPQGSALPPRDTIQQAGPT
jgi:phosphatidylglycerol---prolipoprotein diacylglyceryl transferase